MPCRAAVKRFAVVSMNFSNERTLFFLLVLTVYKTSSSSVVERDFYHQIREYKCCASAVFAVSHCACGATVFLTNLAG